MKSRASFQFAIVACLATTAVAISVPAASAVTLPVDGFAISISESIASSGGLSPGLQNSLRLVAQDRPLFSITNTSTTANISSLTLTMGNSVFAFGSLTLQAQTTASVTSYTPTTVAGQHAGASSMSFTFGAFAPNQTLDFRADIDRLSDAGMSLTNYRQALASGSDPSQWAKINVVFSDGATLQQMITPASISGAPQNPNYSYFYCLPGAPPTGQIWVSGQTTPSEPIPEPATVVLAILGGLCLAVVARRRHTQHA